MYLVDLFYNYSQRFALLALVLIIAGVVVLAKGNSVGWVPLLCGLAIGCGLWGISKHHQRARAKALRAAEELDSSAELRAAQANVNRIYQRRG
jgi:hypothetical protein